MSSKRNIHTLGVNHPDTSNRVQIQKYGTRGLVGVSGVVTHESGDTYFTDTTEARRLVEAGIAIYVKDLHGKVVEEGQ